MPLYPHCTVNAALAFVPHFPLPYPRAHIHLQLFLANKTIRVYSFYIFMVLLQLLKHYPPPVSRGESTNASIVCLEPLGVALHIDKERLFVWFHMYHPPILQIQPPAHIQIYLRLIRHRQPTPQCIHD